MSEANRSRMGGKAHKRESQKPHFIYLL